MQAESIQAWRRAQEAARGGAQAARVAFESLLPLAELELPARLRLSALDLEEGAMRAATEQLLAAYRLEESEPGLVLELARRLFALGEIAAGLEYLRSPAINRADSADLHVDVGSLLADLSFYDIALEHLERAARLGLRSARLFYLLGMARMYCGHSDAAELALKACLREDRDFMPALRLLAGLRRQTPERNHVDLLRAAVARLGDSHSFAPLGHYALFKELDDLGDVEAAWSHLQQGMRTRRAQVSYDESRDEALFAALHRWSPRRDLQVVPVPAQPVPVFVVGMPRSGTTLLEQLLAAHPQLTDAGELRDFVCQLRWCCDRLGGPHADAGLVTASTDIDLHLLGQRYMTHTAWRANGRSHYTDKLPGNFLLAGLIAEALPHARIVHMVRDPMDSCFSNLKALFADAYPHSYSQGEMARHYLRYRRLMAHWVHMFPGRILEIEYESLVTDPQTQTRRVLDFCGLPWLDKVVAGGRRTGMVGTASTVQVREPIHTRYLGQWRAYAQHLVPLQTMLGRSETE